MTRYNPCFFIITCGIASKFQDLGAEVLEDGGKVDGSTGTHSRGVFALAEVSADTTYGELQSGLGG